MPKTVLMITRPYYPSNASGVHRSVANARYLSFFGWTPIVVCKKFTLSNSDGTYDSQLAAIPDVCQVVRVDDMEYCFYKKIEQLLWKTFGAGGYDYRNPYFLYQRMKCACEKIVRNEQIDVIWSTYLPGLDHKIADYLCRKYKIPWVADFRDLPDQSEDTHSARYAVKQEIRTCQTASALIATTDEMAEKLRSRHKVPVYTILNGFDPEDFQSKPEIKDFGNKFTINHFGILYPFRNPSCLFEAIDRLARDSKIKLDDFEVNFYGADAAMVNEWVKAYRCSTFVRVPGRLPYPEMLSRQRASQILLLVTSPEQAGAIPAKLYGYLASQRPVLCVPGDGAGSDRILAQTKAGISSSSPEHIAVWLETAYHQWKQSGLVAFTGVDEEIQKYSRKAQAGQLAEILRRVSRKPNTEATR